MTGPFDITQAGDAGPGCDRFDELLPDFLEGTLSPAARVNAEAHLAACERCAALVADLHDLRTTAAALPALAPSRDLWEGIAERIAAPVIPIEVRDGVAWGAARRRPRAWTPAWLGAAAAALVAVTAGVTYQLTARSATQTVAVVDSVRGSTADSALRMATLPESVRTTDSAGRPGARSSGSEPRPGAPAVRSVRNPRGEARHATAEQTYDREIESLRAILDRRRESLNPATVEVLELNLQIIDQAIAQSRAALVKDPASDFLDRQLDKALEKKLELLRTAALLPAT